jgi:hypothetical protein
MFSRNKVKIRVCPNILSVFFLSTTYLQQETAKLSDSRERGCGTEYVHVIKMFNFVLLKAL